MSAILFELALTGVGVVLSLVLLRRNTREERIQTEDGFDERTAEDRLAAHLETAKTEGSLHRTLRVWKEPILYVVGFMIVGIIGALLYRPPAIHPDILYTIGIGLLLGLLFVCYFVGTGRMKFKRR
jgi:hypothetical protein